MLLPLSIFGLLLWCGGIPLFGIHICTRKNLPAFDKFLMHSCFAGHRDSLHGFLWRIAAMARAFLITVTAFLPLTAAEQFTIITFLLVATIFFEARVKPRPEASMNVMEALEEVTLVLVLLMGKLYMDLEDGSPIEQLPAVVSWIFIVAYCSASVGMYGFQQMHKWQERKQRNKTFITVTPAPGRARVHAMRCGAAHVCMCTRVQACACACACLCACARVRACARLCAHACACIPVRARACLSVRACARVCACVRSCARVCVRAFVCAGLCAFICIASVLYVRCVRRCGNETDHRQQRVCIRCLTEHTADEARSSITPVARLLVTNPFGIARPKYGNRMQECRQILNVLTWSEVSCSAQLGTSQNPALLQRTWRALSKPTPSQLGLAWRCGLWLAN